MRNLTNIMASHESLIAEALDLDRGKMNSSKKFNKNPFTADNPFLYLYSEIICDKNFFVLSNRGLTKTSCGVPSSTISPPFINIT